MSVLEKLIEVLEKNADATFELAAVLERLIPSDEHEQDYEAPEQ